MPIIQVLCDDDRGAIVILARPCPACRRRVVYNQVIHPTGPRRQKVIRMQMVKVKFANEEDRTRGVVGLAKRMRVLALRGNIYVVPSKALSMLDEWRCQYEVVEEGGYDVLVGSLRSVAAAQA